MKVREGLASIGVDKLTLGWILNTLYECGLDSSGTRVADSFENDNELSVSITKLKKAYDGEGNEKTG